MVFNCEIKFDENLYGVYFSGQTITGRVLVTTDQIKSVRGVYLKISGYAECKWTETEETTTGFGKDSTTSTTTIYYSGKNNYLESTTYLIGSQYGNTIAIPMGTNFYNFACVLPAEIPTSFEGNHGHIRYIVSVVFDRPWKFDQTYKMGFTVLKPLDLNYDSPALRIPSQMELTKTFCCWPCRSGPLLITASIPQSGYVPGQQINITINLSNNSNIAIYEISYALNKLIYYHSQTPRSQTKTEIVIVAKGSLPGISAGANAKFERHLQVPPLPPTNNTSCSVIHINYELIVKIKVSGAHVNPVLKIPITIGTIPINMNFPISQHPPQQQINILQPPYSSNIGFNSEIKTQNIGFNVPLPDQSSSTPFLPNSLSIPQNFDNLVPSYEECTDGKQQIGGDDQHVISQPFAPRYPVYNFSPSAPSTNYITEKH